MRHLVLGLLTSFLAVAATPAPPELPPGACDPEEHDHTNPPIIGVNGNSVAWYQCNRDTQTWEPLTLDYSVFNGNACNPANQYLDDDWFGTATAAGTPVLHRSAKPKVVSRVKLKGGGYTLRVKFKAPVRTTAPNVIELCKEGGDCCALTVAPSQALQGKIPAEFGKFDDTKIGYGWFRKGQTPLQFETCRNVNCAP
jgi:hypothetical protein